MQKILNIPERKRKPNVQHHLYTDDFWASSKFAESCD